MKKVLALILSVVLALCVFSACGEEKKKIDDKDAVQALVCEYVDLLFDGSEGALDYVVKDSEDYTKTQALITLVSSVETFAQDNGVSEEYVGELNLQIKNFYNKITGMVSCDVTNTAVENDKASVIVNVLTPDFEKIEEITTKIKTEGRIEALLTPEEKAEYEKSGFSIRYAEIFLGEVLKELDGKNKVTAVTFELEKINSEWVIVKIDSILF